MTHKYVPIKVEIDEDYVIQAKVRLDRIKAIAESLVTVDREGDLDSLDEHTVLNLIEIIDSQADEAKALLKN